MIKVFISHKDTDEKTAQEVANRLEMNQMDFYLDSIDNILLKDGPALTEYLLQRMGECQQLIAVVSSATAKSWWVPWEIGVGSEKGFRMASFTQRNVYLPGYLEKWPVLRSDTDIDLYCKHSTEADERISRVSVTASTRMRYAADFHRDLKRALSLS